MLMEPVLKKMKALSDPTRLRIMLLLLEQELCVCELETVLSVEQSRLSHALRLLRDAGLIDERREGRWVFYKASEGVSPSLRAYLEGASRGNDEAAADRRMAKTLIEESKPSGRRCPLREKV